METVDTCPGRFDFDKLQKIFTNLIANSIKYTPSGGNIRIALSTEKTESDRPTICFTIEDTGPGISKEHLDRIFDRFYRIPESSMAFGAGIGLNLTKELVELLNGTIRVESPVHPDPKHPGARFTVSLPIDCTAPANEEPSGTALHQNAPGNPEKTGEPDQPLSNDTEPDEEQVPLILIVEDDSDICEFVTEGLPSSFRVVSAQNGKEGLQKAKELVPDLIVTDIMMPVMDGITMCRELKTGMETSHIPVIMLTAKTSLESQVEGLKTGADDYVTKPFHMELLRVRIANLLESRRILREKFLREYPVVPPVIPNDAPDKEFLDKMSSVLEKNYTDPLFSTEEFASAMYMSRSSLWRKLKAVTDRTPSMYINEYRIAKAAELLLTTSRTVTEIAFDVGFEDSSNFSRTFKKHCRMSPVKYRDAHTPL
jgi:CheY-like chemotaxis protein